MTKTHRWYDAYRPALFETLRYVALPRKVEARHGWVRLPSNEFGTLIQRVTEVKMSMASLDRPRTGSHTVGFKQTTLYWLAVFLTDPPAYELDGRPAVQTRIGRLSFETERAALLALAIFASKFAFVWWYVTGDDFDVTSGGLKSTPIDPTKFSESAQAALVESAKALLVDFPNHVLFTPYEKKWMGTFVLSEMRDITDRIDKVIAEELGFTELLHALEHAYACVYKPTGDRPGTL